MFKLRTAATFFLMWQYSLLENNYFLFQSDIKKWNSHDLLPPAALYEPGSLGNPSKGENEDFIAAVMGDNYIPLR